MIFGGVFERFPKLKVCFAHGGTDHDKNTKVSTSTLQHNMQCGCSLTFIAFVYLVPGGSFPFTVGRIEHGHRVRPDLCAVDNKISPRKYLGSFYTDSLVHDPVSLKLLIDVIGKVSLYSLFTEFIKTHIGLIH